MADSISQPPTTPAESNSGGSKAPRTLSREQYLHVDGLRRRALELLNREGEWQEIEGYPGRLRGYESDAMFMLHRTPFQPPPISDAAVAAGISAEAQRRAARQFGLDVWQNNRKVLSMIWNEAEMPAVVLFRRGGWEETLARAHRALS